MTMRNKFMGELMGLAYPLDPASVAFNVAPGN